MYQVVLCLLAGTSDVLNNHLNCVPTKTPEFACLISKSVRDQLRHCHLLTHIIPLTTPSSSSASECLVSVHEWPTPKRIVQQQTCDQKFPPTPSIAHICTQIQSKK